MKLRTRYKRALILSGTAIGAAYALRCELLSFFSIFGIQNNLKT